MTVVAGEVIHLIKCTPVEVRVRPTEECYKELPITYHNKSAFLTPKTHIITKGASTTDCSELIPHMYNLHGNWYRVT